MPLDGAALGRGKTGVVLAHQYPSSLCAWVPYAGVLSRAGFRVLLVDHRGFGYSPTPADRAKAGSYPRDLEGAVEELKREGASKVFLMGASFGGVTSMVAGSHLGSREDALLPVGDARKLLRRAGSEHKRLVLFPGSYHGWDLVTVAPDHGQASRIVIGFLRRYG